MAARKVKVTIEKLYEAFLVFAKGVNDKFEKMDKRLEALDQKIDTYKADSDKQFKKLNKKLDTTIRFFDSEIIEDRKRITKLEEDVVRKLHYK